MLIDYKISAEKLTGA